MNFPSLNFKAVNGSTAQAGEASQSGSSESAGPDFESALLSSKSGWAPQRRVGQSQPNPEPVAKVDSGDVEVSRSGQRISDGENANAEGKIDQRLRRSSKRVDPVRDTSIPSDPVSTSVEATPHTTALNQGVESDRKADFPDNSGEDRQSVSGDRDRPDELKHKPEKGELNNSRVIRATEVGRQSIKNLTGSKEDHSPVSEASSSGIKGISQSSEINPEMRSEGTPAESQQSSQPHGTKQERTGARTVPDQLRNSGVGSSRERWGQSDIRKIPTFVSKETSLPTHGQQKISVDGKSVEVSDTRVIPGRNSSGIFRDDHIPTDVGKKSLPQNPDVPVKENTGRQMATSSSISVDEGSEIKPVLRGIPQVSELTGDGIARVRQLPEAELGSTGAERQSSGNVGESETGTNFRRPLGEGHLRNVTLHGTETGSEDGNRITKGTHEHSGELQSSRQIPRNSHNADPGVSDSALKMSANGEGAKNVTPALVGSGRHLLPHQITEQNLPDSQNTGQNGEKTVFGGKHAQTPQNEVTGKMKSLPTSRKSGEITSQEKLGTNFAHNDEMVDRSAKYANGRTESGLRKSGPEIVGDSQDNSIPEQPVLLNDLSSSTGNEFSASHDHRGGNELPMEASTTDGDDGQLEAVASRRTDSVRPTSQSQGKGQDLTRVEQLSEMLIKEVVRLRPLANGELKMKVQLAEGGIEMTLVQKGEWVEARLARESQESLQLSSQIGQMNESLARHLIRVTSAEAAGSNFNSFQSDSRQGAGDLDQDLNHQNRHHSEQPRQSRHFSDKSENRSEPPGQSENHESDLMGSGLSPQSQRQVENEHIGQIDLVA